MKYGGSDMDDNIGEKNELRDYLLGNLKDDVIQERIEKQLMTDDEFGSRVDAAGQQLIEDYLDGDLSGDESIQFEQFFLAAPEHRRQVRLTKNLRRFSAGAGGSVLEARRSWFDGFATPSLLWLRFAALAVLVAAAAFGVWRFATVGSDVDKGLAELRKAYQGQRITESRLTALPDHVPFTETRGPGGLATDPAARDRAERYLSDASRDDPGARSHHALALFYLAERKYDRAEREFESAIALAPDDPVLRSDAGAMYLEMAKAAQWQKDGAPSQLLDKSLEHLERAITLEPRLAEARFNRALAMEALLQRGQAKKAWQEYLEIDGTSKWADEARRRISALEENVSAEMNADELETAFLEAVRQGSEEYARQLLGNNRELITDKYLPQRLSMSFINAPPERREVLLHALRSAGELEMKNGDPFAKEIALFYAQLGDERREAIRSAQTEIRHGFKECIGNRYENAIPYFVRARETFLSAGDRWDAALAGYFLAYAQLNTERVSESLTELESVADFARRGQYAWLEATVNYWVGGVNSKMGRHTEARRAHERALEIADGIQDSYAAQRNLVELARLSSVGGQKARSLAIVERLLLENHRSASGARQKFRTLSYAAEILASLKLLNAAKPVILDAVSAAEETGSAFNLAMGMSKTGDIYRRLGAFDEARKWLQNGLSAALSIDNAATRDKTRAHCIMRLGDLEKDSANFAAARDHYAEAAQYYRTVAMPYFLVIAINGLLVTDLELGNDIAVEGHIAENIRIVEEYRERISDEREKSGFLDETAGVYDLAAAFEYKRGNAERAYDYAEMSSSRALLDWLRRGAAIKTDSGRVGIFLEAEAAPATLSDIRQRMPAAAQILQYSVLDDRLLVWVISKEKFVARSIDVNSDDLESRVEEFRRIIAVQDAGAAEAGRGLYDLLVAPVRNDIDPDKEICLVPGGVLFTLPFAALITPKGDPVIKDLRLVYAPSANVFLHLTERATQMQTSKPEAVLAIGDPAFDRAYFELPYLNAAVAEVNNVAETYARSETLIGKAATEQAIIAKMPDADVVHFAGHYVAEAGSPMSSYLLLADSGDVERSKLTNIEIAESRLDARLIVLAACRTGTESYSAGEGLAGLSRTFLGINVPLVVGSLWSVDSAATARLMTLFHKFRRNGSRTSSAALRAAQLELLGDPTGQFNAPYYWSAFAVYGGHAGF